MSPDDFLDGLLVHFGKRHASPEAEQIWMRDMRRLVDRIDRTVLAKAYDLIVREHDDRAFPLPAQISAWVTRAANDLHTPAEHRPFEPVAEVKPEDAATRKAAVAALMKDFRAAMAAKTLPVDNHPTLLPPVQRPEFEAAQRASRNLDLHMTQKGVLTALSKRMTGDRE